MLNEEFTEKVMLFRRQTGMYILKVTYSEVCAFVNGLDVGVGGGVVHGFRHWLISRGAERPELGWPMLVLCEVYPVEDLPNLAGFSVVENERVIQVMFDLLYEYLNIHKE